jgi:hypothetical protein
MKTLKYLLFAVLVLSTITACSGDNMSERETDDLAEQDLLESGLNNEMKLTGTKWKLAALVDVQTGESIEPEPKDCKKCYTLEFDSDTTAIGKSVMNEILLLITPSKVRFGITKIDDNINNNVNLFYDALKILDTIYEYSKNELKFYYAGKKKYLLFKPLAQEYYYWSRGEKVPLVLDPTRKYISVRSTNDTLALKNRLIEQNIHVPYFMVYRSVCSGKYLCGAIIEGNNLPNFTEDETIVYEGEYFLSERGIDVGGLNEEFIVRLKNPGDLPALENLAKENNITLCGTVDYSAGSGDSKFTYYTLTCSKLSKGNCMQMANLFYESGLCDVANIGVVNYGTDAAVGGIEDI